MLNICGVIVCHCHGVSDRTIQFEAGLGAGDVDEVARRCGAGADCGGCLPTIEDLLEIRTLDTPLTGTVCPAAAQPRTGGTTIDLAS